MSKFFSVGLLIAFCAFLYLVQAQTTSRPTRSTLESDRRLCARLNRRCERNNPSVGVTDEITDTSNAQCRVIRGPQWRNLTRCQILRAHCELSLVRCAQISCLNVENLINPRIN